jgi:hypothetical protein
MTVHVREESSSLAGIASNPEIELTDLVLPQDFLDRARGFAVAADATVARGNAPRPLPSHALLAPITFLLAQSIELALKAFVLHKGYPFEKVKSELGHDIPKALKMAEQYGFSERQAYDRYAFDCLDKVYRFENKIAKKLQYPSPDGSMLIPCPRALRELTAEIISEAAVTLWGRSDYDTALNDAQEYNGLTIPHDATYSGPSLSELRSTAGDAANRTWRTTQEVIDRLLD